MTVATGRGWMERAGCRGVDPELFFPHAETSSEADSETDGETGRRRYGEQVAAAKAVCAGCPVRSECLRFALGALTDGVAGGLDAHERRALRRSRPARGSGCTAGGGATARDGSTAGDGAAAGEAGSSGPAAVAREGRAAGRSLGSLAVELGVSTRTIERWTRTGAA